MVNVICYVCDQEVELQNYDQIKPRTNLRDHMVIHFLDNPGSKFYCILCNNHGSNRPCSNINTYMIHVAHRCKNKHLLDPNYGKGGNHGMIAEDLIPVLAEEDIIMDVDETIDGNLPEDEEEYHDQESNSGLSSQSLTESETDEPYHQLFEPVLERIDEDPGDDDDPSDPSYTLPKEPIIFPCETDRDPLRIRVDEFVRAIEFEIAENKLPETGVTKLLKAIFDPIMKAFEMSNGKEVLWKFKEMALSKKRRLTWMKKRFLLRMPDRVDSSKGMSNKVPQYFDIETTLQWIFSREEFFSQLEKDAQGNKKPMTNQSLIISCQ